ncbi:MAG: hypothetical protein HY720_21440 [Planctomycetes bacterium]|nr:hypothetical protein [Planctomycetota bacterium]
MTRSRRGVFLAAAIALSGCGFSDKSAESFDHVDPFHDRFQEVNRLYMESPFVEYPTKFGNVVLWLAASPVWGLTAVGEDIASGDGTHPAARSIMAGAGYGGGAIFGSPFLGLYWGFFSWWWDLFVEPGRAGG